MIPGSGGSSEGGNGNPLQYSCLGNPMDRGAWQTIVHGVTKSQTQLSNLSTTLLHSVAFLCPPFPQMSIYILVQSLCKIN